jgi:hypothetical protein
MTIALIVLYIIGAYGLFMGVTYALAKVLFPKLEDTRNFKGLTLRQLSHLNPRIPERIQKFTSKQKQRKLAY